MSLEILCPTCLQTEDPDLPSVANPLQLDEPSGHYQCEAGHDFTISEVAQMMHEDEHAATHKAAKKPNTPQAHKTAGKGKAQPPAKKAALKLVTKTEDAPEEDVSQNEATATQKAAQDLTQNQDAELLEMPPFLLEKGIDESSQIGNTLMTMPNGDAWIRVSIPETYTGPVEELAAVAHQTPQEWADEFFHLRLEEFFGA